MAYIPGTQRLIAAFDTVVYEKSSTTSTWQRIAVPGMTSGRSIYGFDFSRITPTKIVFGISVPNSANELKVYNESTATWSTITIPPPSGTVHQGGDYQVSVSGNDVAFTSFTAKRLSDNAMLRYFAKTDLSTSTSTFSQFTGYTTFPENIKVSPTNPAIIYGTHHTGYDNETFSISTDTGQTFTYLAGPSHGDGRSLYIWKTSSSGNGLYDVVFGTNDGGVAMKKSGNLGFKSIVGNGLCAAEMWAATSPDNDETIIGGGSQDNSTFFYHKGGSPEWHGGIIGGDNYKSKFARFGRQVMYGEVNFPDMSEVDVYPGYILPYTINPPTDHNSIPFWASSANKARPLYFDTGNVAHVGYYSSWRQNIGDASWNQLFYPEAKPNNQTEYYQVLKFILPEKTGYTSTAYIGYKGQGSDATSNDPTGLNTNPRGRLYFASNVSKSNVITTAHQVIGQTPWQNITPGAVGWWRMTDFETDPNNAARIWVTLGDIQWGTLTANPSSQTNRILYSSNYGATWTDVSKGLPALPVSKIIYQKGTDDVLYAGTDVGVFIWNKAQGQWCQFNKNLPPCVVTDMEINYCAGKLRISTYGRGVWECDIMNETATYNPHVGDFVPSQDNTITANTTWSSDKFIDAGIRVKSGYTLTINNTAGTQTVIHMPKNGAIVVEPNATLIVNGAKITNDCGGFWKGILVEGHYNQPQSPVSNQGVAYIQNGAIIEHARLGIANYGESVEPNWGITSGGIIHINGATFRNCARSVGFAPYHNQVGKVIQDNVSSIEYSTFTVDNNYKGETLNYGFQAHINMSNVDGIYIAGNSFSNTSTMPHTAGTGQGIISWDGSFNAVPYCTSTGRFKTGCPPGTLVHNTFQGFNIGIYSNNGMIDPLDYCFVDYADFNSNGVGLYAKYNHWCEVFHNTFKLDRSGYPYGQGCNCQKGIWLYASDQFRVEENSFSDTSSGRYSGTPLTVEGARIDSCGANINDLYRNTFTHLNNGIVAWGKNAQLTARPDTTSIGFQASCNTFNFDNGSGRLTGTPIGIYGNGAYNTFGIRSAQGSISRPVENKYSPVFNWGVAVNQFDNHGQPLYYYYGGASNTYIETRPGVNTPPNSFQGAWRTNHTNTCAMRTIRTAFGGPCYGCTAVFTASVSNYVLTLAPLVAKIDRGGTGGLLTAIDAGTYGTALADTLMSIAPFLSDAVLREAAAASRVPKSQMLGVLAACPDMLNEDLLQYLGTDMQAPYSPDDITFLRQHQFDTSARTSMIGAMNDAYADMALAHEDVIASLMMDTNGVNVDTLIYWYHQFPAPWARYHEAFIRLGQHDYDGAQSTLTNTATDFNLSTDETNVLNTYKDIVTLLSGAFQAGRTEITLDSAELASLNTYAGLGHGAASSYALNLYNQNLGILSMPCDMVSTDSSGGGGNQQRITYGNNTSSTLSYTTVHEGVTAYPNPAHEQVTFSYNLPNAAAPLTLIVSTVGGKEVWTTVLPAMRGLAAWDAHNVSSSIYLYKIVSGQKTIASGKVTIEK